MHRTKNVGQLLKKNWCRRCASSKSSAHANNYCLELVKKHDYEHYLCALLLPKAARNAVFALRAFNVEVALIQDVVSEERVGLMRMQFWKDTLDQVFKGNPPEQPVAIALAHALEKRDRMSKMWLTRLLDAREKALTSHKYHLTTTEMEAYSENTFSSLLYLSLEAANVRNMYSDHAASHIGKAEGIVTLLRSVPYFASKRQVLLPMEVLMRHGSSQEDVIQKRVEKPLKDAIYDLASLAYIHLQKARSQAPHLLASTKSVLLPSVPCEKFLRQIQRADFDPFCVSLSQRDPKMPLHLLWNRLRRNY